MEWFQILAAIGAACVFAMWMLAKFPNQLGGDAAGAAMLSGFLFIAAAVAFVISAIGWAFS